MGAPRPRLAAVVVSGVSATVRLFEAAGGVEVMAVTVCDW